MEAEGEEVVSDKVTSTWPFPDAPGMPLTPDCDGWHMLAEWDDQANQSLIEFVLWWDGVRSIWFCHRGDCIDMGDTMEKTAEFYRYVRPMQEVPCV